MESVERRMLISPARSGSTTLMHSLSQHPDVTCIKGGVGRQSRTGEGKDDYEAYNVAVETRWAVIKTTFASIPGMTDFNPFPAPWVAKQVRPLFLFRDPTYTWQSLKKRPWADFGRFLESYLNVYRLFEVMEGEVGAACITYEKLVGDPEAGLRKILNYWGIGWNPSVVSWVRPFSADTFMTSTPELRALLENDVMGVGHRTLKESTGWRQCNNNLDIPPRRKRGS